MGWLLGGGRPSLQTRRVIHERSRRSLEDYRSPRSARPPHENSRPTNAHQRYANRPGVRVGRRPQNRPRMNVSEREWRALGGAGRVSGPRGRGGGMMLRRGLHISLIIIHFYSCSWAVSEAEAGRPFNRDAYSTNGAGDPSRTTAPLAAPGRPMRKAARSTFISVHQRCGIGRGLCGAIKRVPRLRAAWSTPAQIARFSAICARLARPGPRRWWRSGDEQGLDSVSGLRYFRPPALTEISGAIPLILKEMSSRRGVRSDQGSRRERRSRR